MNKWEMLILGWCVGSLSTAFLLAWWITPRSEFHQERLADARGDVLRPSIPPELHERMWRNIESRLPQ